MKYKKYKSHTLSYKDAVGTQNQRGTTRNTESTKTFIPSSEKENLETKIHQFQYEKDILTSRFETILDSMIVFINTITAGFYQEEE